MEDPQVVIINATIYPWQREALEQFREDIGVRSLSEALRAVISRTLPRPEKPESVQPLEPAA